MEEICDNWHAVCANALMQFQPLLSTNEVITGQLLLSPLWRLQLLSNVSRIDLLRVVTILLLSE